MNGLFSRISRDGTTAQRGFTTLLYAGWAITMSYFPSGVLLFYLGSAVYVRDLLLAVHLIASLVWLYRIGDLQKVMRDSAILLLVPLLLIPALADGDYRFEAMRTVKWTFFWLDWIFIGHFAFQKRNWDHWLGIFIGVTAFELVMEWLIGAYEWKVGHYVFATPTTWQDKTLFGVQAVKDLMLEGRIRVRGFQRDVFSFANLMAMSAVIGLAWASISRTVWERVIGFGWAAFFAIMLVISGGRSALFGIFASTILSIAYAVDHRFTRNWSRNYVLAWLAITVVISFAGVGRLTEAIGSTLLSKTSIGDSESAYMRDQNWSNMLDAFEEEPIILVIGGPYASLLDTRITPMFHWADNQFLWDAYHLGLAGEAAIAFYFFRVLWRSRESSQPRAVDVVVLCLLFVVGEGIARESLTFMGCMPLFVACGYVSATTTGARHQSERHSRSRRRRGSSAPQQPLPFVR
jgi:hypothetical protein